MERVLKGFQMVRRDQRGDTIVEVLIALAVLGAVLGGAYVVSNRNMSTNRVSQERLVAMKLAEGQLEKLKSRAASDDETIFTQTNFCFTATNALVSSSSAACKVDTAGQPTTEEPRYQVVVNRVGYVALGSRPQAGTRYGVTVTWLNARGDGTDRLDYYYEVYR